MHPARWCNILRALPLWLFVAAMLVQFVVTLGDFPETYGA